MNFPHSCYILRLERKEMKQFTLSDWILWIVILFVILFVLLACSQEYTINCPVNSEKNWTQPQGLWLSVLYERDSTYAYFYERSVFIGVGVYARTGDKCREYNDFTVTGNDTIKLIINERRYELWHSTERNQ